MLVPEILSTRLGGGRYRYCMPEPSVPLSARRRVATARRGPLPGSSGKLQWKIVDFLLILVNIAAKYRSGANTFFWVDHSEAAERKYVVFWGVATFFLRRILDYNQQKSGIPDISQTMSGQDSLRICFTMLIAAGILRSRTRNCDRDLTRYA